MVQAQAQAQKQEEITAQESLELCKALLRVSIYHVSYLRGIFPEDHYKTVDMKNLDNMSIAMLTAKTEEATRLIHWVEGGVPDALEKRYLRKVFFGISRDKEGTDLLEEYVFNFSYDEEGGVHMEAGPGSKHKFSTRDSQTSSKSKGPSLSGVKYQVCRLMRMLVEITNTLDKVPEERYLFMKLTYTDDTPEEYEPPMFAPAKNGGVGCFNRMPFVMEVGRVDTRHIKVGLAVKTILDNVDEEEGWEEGHLPVADDNSNLFLETSAGGGGGAHQQQQPSGGQDASMGGGFSCAGGRAAAAPGAEAGEVCQSDKRRESGGEVDPSSQQHRAFSSQELEGVKTWLLNRRQEEAHLLDALARFGSIPSSTLEACFQQLVATGLLLPTAEADCYRINRAGSSGATTGAAAAAAADELQAAEAAMQALTVGLASQQGGVHEAAGSERTVSVAGKRKPQAEPEEETQQGGAKWFPESQPSQNGMRQAKKASMVEQAIHQNKRQRRAKADKAPAAAAPVAVAAPGGRPRRSARNQQ